MNSIKQLCGAAVLTFVLAFSAFAGDIHDGVIDPPPPPPPSIQCVPEDDPDCTNTSNSQSASFDPVLETALDLLQDALLLF